MKVSKKITALQPLPPRSTGGEPSGQSARLEGDDSHRIATLFRP